MYELTQEKFTKSNKALLKDLHLSLGIDKSVLSNNQLLQKLSQAFFSKPFEEVQKTILSEKKELNLIWDNVNRYKMFLISYDNELLLVINGELETGTYIHVGDDKEQSHEKVTEIAQEKAKELNSFITKIKLPSILGDEWNYNEIVNLAEKMGYFKYQTTLFELIDSNTTKNFIDGEYVPFSLDGEWEEKMIGEHEEYPEDEIGECFIWNAEVGTNKSPDFKEYFFTFNDICNAVLCDDGSWLIKEDNNMKRKLTFSKDM
jgi:hypothetical protein